MSDEEREARAAARRANPTSVPIRSFRLAEEPLLDDRDDSTVDDRIREVFRLSQAAYHLSGQKLPSYTRAEMPGRVFRRR